MAKQLFPTSSDPKESSLRALLLGVFLSVLFALSNAYLALKIGTTISASVPAAIISMAVLRALFHGGTILENNIVQTVATVGEGLAAGIVFTIPALFLLGAPPSILKISLLSFLGGVLGVLFMIPLRRFLIVEEDGKIPFPEGTACAEILHAGSKSAKSAKVALTGFLTAFFYRGISGIGHLWKELVELPFPIYPKAFIAFDTTPALLGVGFIVGYRVTSLIFAGSLFAWFLLLPLIQLFANGNDPIFPGNLPVAMMDSSMIWSEYIRYIGAGAIAFGGLVSLLKICPILIKTLREGVKELRLGSAIHKGKKRTEQDIPFLALFVGSLSIIFLLWLLPIFSFNLFTVFLLTVLGFFFSAVTSLTVGIVGSTSNPVSGMVISTLLITCVLFVLLGWTDRAYLLSAITMSAVTNVTICMAATTSQDLKTGYLVKATPYKQQIAEMLGTLLPSLVLGVSIYLLNEAYTLGSVHMPAPQATMIAMIAEGVIHQELPYVLFTAGILLGVLLLLLEVPILPFALGVYLPLSLTAASMVGGVVAKITEKSSSPSGKKTGVLLASGLIGGDASMGVVIACATVFGLLKAGDSGFLPPYLSLLAYLFLATFLGYFSYDGGRIKR